MDFASYYGSGRGGGRRGRCRSVDISHLAIKLKLNSTHPPLTSKLTVTLLLDIRNHIPTDSSPRMSSQSSYPHFRIFDQASSSAQPLNLAGLMGRVKQPQEDQGEEILLQPNPTRALDRRTPYVPSPTLSYYANFIPATPAPPVPSLAQRITTTSFASHCSASPSTRPHDRTLRRKEPPAPIDIERASVTGRKAEAMNRQLPLVITLDSPIKEETSHVQQVALGGQTVPVPREGSSSPQNRRGVKNIWRSKSKSKKIAEDTAEPSPEWVEVEQGYRHPSWMGGLDIGGIDLLKPSGTDNATSLSPSAQLAPSPGTGGILHNILLTPTQDGSTSRHRTPSPNRSSTNLIPAGVSQNASYDAAKKQKRRTLMDRAGRLLNEQRMKLVYDTNKRDDLDRLNNVKIGGLVPHSFSGYKGHGRDTIDPSGKLPAPRMHSYATSDSARGSGYETKGRYAMDSGRQGSFSTSNSNSVARGGSGSGYEKPSREMYMRSTADRDALLRKRRRKKIMVSGFRGIVISQA